MISKLGWKAIDRIGDVLVLVGCLSVIVVVGAAPDLTVLAGTGGGSVCDVLNDPNSDCNNGCTNQTVYFCGGTTQYCKTGMQDNTDCTDCMCQSVSGGCHCTK